MSARNLIIPSERTLLAPFDVTLGEVRPRDQRDLMERPFFSLAKTKRVKPILYKAGTTEVQVHAVAEHGMATIWDADVLIWAASQLVEAADLGLRTSRFIRFTPYQLLLAIGRGTGQRQYRLLRGSFNRLHSTVVATSIRQGEHWRNQPFSWITEWEERIDAKGRAAGVELVLPDWFYRGVLDRSLVLTIDPAYFRLSGGIERWLYRVARKHAGRQPDGWTFELRHLHEKSGVLARYADFLVDLRRIVARQRLPGYEVRLGWEAGRSLLELRPRAPVDGSGSGLGISGALGIGTSGAGLSVHRAQRPHPKCWPATRNPRLNSESNQDSNFVAGARALGKTRRGGEGPR